VPRAFRGVPERHEEALSFDPVILPEEMSEINPQKFHIFALAAWRDTDKGG
jgi:hypothetical protein